MSRSGEVAERGGRAEDLPAGLWLEAGAARHRLLMLDYDGTLVSFRVDRREAWPRPEAVRLLERIAAAGRTRLAVISGRPVAELRRFLDVRGVTLVGEHGWERWSAGDGLVLHPLAPGAAEALRDLGRAGRRTTLGPWLEEKRTSLVLHLRGLAGGEAARAAAVFREMIGVPGESAGLRLQEIAGGLELRARGRDKASAVRELRATCPDDVFSVYIGDDATDEDGFRGLQGIGVTIRVGTDDRPSLARHRLEAPPEVLNFLRLWVDQVETRAAADARGAP